MIFRQLIDAESQTLTYLLGDPWSREAVIIDPVRENITRDLAFLEQLGLKLIYTLETHVHADHVTAGALLRQATGCKVVLSSATGVESADILVADGDAVRFGLQALEVRATPGHTSGCVSYVAANHPYAFTGDTLLIRGCGRTDFQQGDSRTLYRSVRDKLFSLPDETLVYPAHDYKGRTVSSIREEKNYNPRLGGGRTEDQFVAIMEALNLAYPRKMDLAVPANQRCGLLNEEELETTDVVLSSPILASERTPTGAPSVPVIWVANREPTVRLVDIRTTEEVGGPDGFIEGSEHIPMDRLESQSTQWDREAPVVLYCRSGGRSDRAAILLERSGFRHCGSMKGGILKWTELGLPLGGGTQG